MNPSSVNHTVSKLASGVALVTIALVPLAMLPTTSNYFETTKLILIIAATAILLLLWAARTVITQSLNFKLTPLNLPFLVYGLVNFLSAFVSTPKTPVAALMDRGSLMPALALFVLAVTNLIDNRKFVRHALYTLIGSGTLLAIITIFQSFGFGLSNLINQLLHTSLPNTLAFTPAGSPVALLTFLTPVMLLSLILAFTKKDPTEKVSLFVLTSLMAAGFIVTSVYSFPGKDTSPLFLPFRAGYAIAIETLKNPQTALVGVGTNSFVVAFNQFRPGYLNNLDIWNIRFGVSSNEIFQILTTVGAIGLAAFGWLVSLLLRDRQLNTTGVQSQAIKLATFATLLLFFLLPATYLMLFVFAVLLTLWSLQLVHTEQVKVYAAEINPDATRPQTLSKLIVYTPSLLIAALAIASIYFAGRAYAAEMTIKQAIDAATNNDGLNTYNHQRQAIIQNPYLPSYRRSYATTNLALANAIAGNKELSDKDKENIAQLIQQAIREAKIAVSLEPQNAANWETLATIYRALINAAEGADQWTVAALSQAIQTDPTNPRLRVDLGGIYYSLNRHDQAIRLFQQAAELKPDYTNAYYNLSHSYAQKKDAVAAYDYMQQVLKLVKTDSADYTKAKEELTELAKFLPKQEQTKAQEQVEQTAPAQTNLNAPSPAPSPSNQVNLPEGSGPDNLNVNP